MQNFATVELKIQEIIDHWLNLDSEWTVVEKTTISVLAWLIMCGLVNLCFWPVVAKLF